MREKNNWSMTSTEEDFSNRNTRWRWEFSTMRPLFCLCNEAFPLLFIPIVLLMRDFEKKEEIFYFFIKTLNFLLLKKKLHKSISHARII